MTRRLKIAAALSLLLLVGSFLAMDHLQAHPPAGEFAWTFDGVTAPPDVALHRKRLEWAWAGIVYSGSMFALSLAGLLACAALGKVVRAIRRGRRDRRIVRPAVLGVLAGLDRAEETPALAPPLGPEPKRGPLERWAAKRGW